MPGAVLGGFGPALVRPLEMGGTLVRNALSPILDAGEGALTAAGRRVLASLTADGLTVSDALARMRELGPAATLADAGGTNVRGLGEVVAHSPGEGSNLAQKTLQGRMDEQGVRAHSAVTEATGETGAVHAQAEQLMAQRAAAARPLYDKALNQTVPLTPRLQELLATPDLQRAMKEGVATAQRNAVAAGEPFNPVDYLHPEPGAPISMKALDAAKQGIDDAVEAYRDPTTGKLNLDGKGRSINALRAAFVSHLDSANPDYAAARAAYAGPSQSLDAMNMGAKALNNQPDVTKAAIANLAPGDKKFFLNGFTSALQHKIATNPDGANVVRRIFNNSNIRANIEAAIGDPAAFAKFQAKMEAEATFAATRNQILAGSQTARRLAAQNAQNFDVTPHLAAAAGGNVPGAIAGAARGAYNYLMMPGAEQLASQGRLLFSQDPEFVRNALSGVHPSIYDSAMSGATALGIVFLATLEPVQRHRRV
ncbi:MAG: hypothetical protein B7Z69_06970, partial [Actinobacteria bacterium 21-73-9]